MAYGITKIYFFLFFSLLCNDLLAVNTDSFMRLSLENEILVEIGERAGKAPWVRATTEINGSAGKIAELLSDFTRYAEIFSECFASARVLEMKQRTARLHIVWSYPIFFRNRDSINRYEIQKKSDGSYRLNWTEDSRPGDPSEGVRLTEVEGSVEITPLEPNRSRLIYRYIGDMGGDFSKAIKEAAWKREPEHFFRAIVNELKTRTKTTQ